MTQCYMEVLKQQYFMKLINSLGLETYSTQIFFLQIVRFSSSSKESKDPHLLFSSHQD